MGVFWLVDGKPDKGRTGANPTTQIAAASAEAQVMPTEPKLRVEPK
jgi:hypothetical protein